MRKIKKLKFTAILLTMALCLYMVPPLSIHAEALPDLYLVNKSDGSGTITGQPGQEIDVSVMVRGGAPIGAASFNVVYDNTRLKPISAVGGPLTAGCISQANLDYKTLGTTVRFGTVSTTSFVGTGDILDLKFKVLDNAPSGTASLQFGDLLFGDDKVPVGKYVVTSTDNVVNVVQNCTVTYETNGGTSVPSVTVPSSTQIATAPVSTKVGNDLVGWCLDSQLTTLATFPYTVTSNTTFYAKWSTSQYTLTLNTNGGSAISAIKKDYNTSIIASDIGTPTKQGYTFSGWYIDSGFTTPVSFPYTLLTDTTFFAKWTVNQYTISFTTNGGTAVAAIKQDYNTTIASSPKSTKTGYTLTGWYSDVGLTQKVSFPYTILADATLYANWAIGKNTITFNSNGGSAVEDIVQDYNTSVSSLPTPTKTGYTFSGWYTDSGLISPVSLPYLIKADATFYAKWTVNQYTVRFSSTGGSAVANITQDYGSTINTSPVSTRTGYTFDGWYIDSSPIQKVSFPYTITDNITFFARWTISSYTVNFDTDGGSNVPAVMQNYGTTIDSVPTTTKTGYSFDGWYTDAARETPAIFPYTITSNATIYAKWEINQYIINFVSNGGSAVLPIEQDYNTTINTSPVSTRTGYNLDGWYSDSSLTHKVSFPYTITDDGTFYAKWTIASYTVTFNTDGGSDVPAVMQNYNTTIDSAPTTTKTGYTFNGWYIDATLKTPVAFPYTVTSDATMYAKWTINQYTITFVPNGGSLVSPIKQDYNTTIATAPVSTLDGYRLIGWYTDNAFTTQVTFPYTIKNDATLYAKFVKYERLYTVTYDANGATGGTVPIDSTTYGPMDKVITADNTGTLTKTNYKFDGWNTKADGTGTAYAVGSPLVIQDNNVILYAQWKSTAASLTSKITGIMPDGKTITITGLDGTMFDVNTKIIVSRLTLSLSSDRLKLYNDKINALSKGSQLIEMFDISLKIGNDTVEPSGRVQITIGLPDSTSTFNTLNAFYFDNDGNAQIMPSSVVGGNMFITTTHCSNYAISGISAAANNDNPKTSETLQLLRKILPYVLISMLLIGASCFVKGMFFPKKNNMK